MQSAKKKLLVWGLSYCYIFLAWNYYHVVTRFPSWVDEIVFKPFIELLPILLVVFIVEKADWRSLGFVQKNILRNIFLGLGVGLILIAVRYVIKIVVGSDIKINPQGFLFLDYVAFSFVSLAVGFQEEIMFRGYFLQRFVWIFGNTFIASVLTSVMFALSHTPFAVIVLQYTSRDLFFYVAQIICMGIVFAFLYRRTRSIFPSMVAHAIWKFSNALFI